MISDTIQEKIHEAMKVHDEVRLSTLRLLSSALSYEKIAKQRDLTDEDEIDVVRREAKKREDSIVVYEKVGSKERAEKERQELKILKEYLPPEMSEDELLKVVDTTITELGAKSIAEMGKVISVVKIRTGGRADGRKISELVRNKLTQS